MYRRSDVRLNYGWLCVAIFVLILQHRTAHSAEQCQPDPIYGTVCTVGVPPAQFATSAYMQQQQDEWCWAASVSMIWAYYGLAVTQSEIVSSALSPTRVTAATALRGGGAGRDEGRSPG